MRNANILAMMLLMLIVVSVGCETSEVTPADDFAIQLPPYETMAIDFSDFEEDGNSGKTTLFADKGTNGNWLYSRIVVGFWNTAVFTTLTVPVASFKAAFNHSPEYLGENVWQWTYTVDGFTAEYTTRLTGEMTETKILWKMYVTRSGIEPFEEFLWFTGESAMDGMSGHWILNQSPERPNAMLRIDWERSSTAVAAIRYTWIRELNDREETDLFRESYLQYGLQESEFDAYFDAHVYSPDFQGFVDVRIEWSRANFYGRVMAEHVFQDMDWHCWDSAGQDTPCE